jgi:hypothetical protein
MVPQSKMFIIAAAPIKPFRITYHTDGTEGAVAAGTNILPALADTGNTGFCIDFQER